MPTTTVLTDGRVIWRGDDGRLLVRQLTPASLDDFMNQVRSTGLFGASAQYRLERRPDTPEPPGHGLCLWSFTWRDHGAAADVEIDSAQWLGDEEEAAYYIPSPERETLDGLARRVMDAPDWYGDDGWQQPAAILYEPEEYLILVSVEGPGLATEGVPDLDEVTWPFAVAPDEVGVVYGSGEPLVRCAVAGAESVETLAEEVGAAAGPPPYFGAGAYVPWQAREATISIAFWPQLPDGRPTCEGS